MNVAQLIPVLVAALGGGGLVGAVVALFKLRPESGAIVVTAAQGALVVQSSVLNELHKENERLRSRVSALERELAALRVEVHGDRDD